MPRAFLITNKRYNSCVDYEDVQPSREWSPERRVSTAESGPILPPTPCDSETDSLGFEGTLVKPTSPHSPAHVPSPRTPTQQSPVDDRQQQVVGFTLFHGMAPATPPPTYTHLSVTPPSTLFRPTTGSTLVTVIRQLMHPNNSPLLQRSSSDSPFQPDSHVCGECGKRYSTSSNLARHRQTHRSVTDKKARKCPHCDKVYVSMPAYSMHVRTHSQGCQCPYCGKCFSRPWLLQGHVRTHTGEKPFTCPVCRKAFADKSNLRAHIQTHSSSKPYVCQRCGKAFALKSYLYKHEESSCMRVHRQQQQHSPSMDHEDQEAALNLATTKDLSCDSQTSMTVE